MTSSHSQTIDHRTFAIGVLSVTACVLFVGLLMVGPQPARAAFQHDRAGDYIMLTMQVSTTKEVLVVIDGAARRMIVYEFDFNRRNMEMIVPPNLYPLADLPKPPVRDEAPRRRN
ncbi:MAG: hypothetical protein IPM18_11430 [Phycisphaerales bacterium]|nr:hypothetical protein [Phycisphaerales bacterium]